MSVRYRVGALLHSPSGRVALLLATGVAVALGLAFSSWRQGAEADGLLAEAETLLGAPLDDAPELRQIPATEALDRLEEAAALGAQGSDVERLRQTIEAVVHLQAGDLIFAEGSLRTARLGAGWTPLLRTVAGEVARQRGDLALAREHARAGLALDADHPRAQLLLADLLLDEAHSEEAEEALRGLLATHEHVAPLHNRRALALEDLGRVTEAELELRRATELDDELADPWINLGRLQLDRGAAADAVASFDRAIRLQPGSSDAHLGRGLARVADDRRGAAADFRRAAELAPHTAVPLLALGDLERSRGDVDEAIDIYREAIARDASPAAGWVKLGNALMLRERFSAARTAYREAIDRDARLSAAHNGLGAAHLALGQLSDAEAALRRAADLDPGDPHPWRNLARVRRASGDERGAQAALVEADGRHAPFI